MAKTTLLDTPSLRNKKLESPKNMNSNSKNVKTNIPSPILVKENESTIVKLFKDMTERVIAKYHTIDQLSDEELGAAGVEAYQEILREAEKRMGMGGQVWNSLDQAFEHFSETIYAQKEKGAAGKKYNKSVINAVSRYKLSRQQRDKKSPGVSDAKKIEVLKQHGYDVYEVGEVLQYIITLKK